LPAGTDPADLARYISTVLVGMAGGASREQLQRLAELTPRAWPT
jgi:hypothetical protein